MAVYNRLIDFDREFSMLKNSPIILNDVEDLTEADRGWIKQMTITTYSNDTLSSLPSCQCGNITGAVNLNLRCVNCNTVVTNPMEQTIESILWFRAPKGVKALISPIMFTLLCKRFRRNGFDTILWLCDTTYRSESKKPGFYDQLIERKLVRGLNNFIENFDSILNTLLEIKVFKVKKNTTDPLMELIKINRHCIFCNHLPIPNKAINILDKTPMGTFVDPVTTGVLDATLTIKGIDNSLSNASLAVRQNRTAKTINSLSRFYKEYTSKAFSSKSGIFRKHVYGTRGHWTFRCVVGSITEPHRYDDVVIPWGTAVSVFELHLTNKLTRKGLSYNDATGLLRQYSNRYHDLINECFIELINESPNSRGIPIIGNRQPSLGKSSMQYLYIVKVKTDPLDITVGIPITAVNGWNA